MQNKNKIFNKNNIIKGVFIIMCLTIVAANLNISQAVKAIETTQDNKIKSGEPEPVKYSGSCEDTTTWIENPEDHTVTTIAYFVKNDSRRFETTDTPKTAPGKYYRIMCGGGDRVNYKDSNGNLIRINNKFVQSVVTREIDEINEVIVNGKLETQKTKKSITENYYINNGNDYVAKFPADPNHGFYFKTSSYYDGAVFEVVKVNIGGKSLNINTPTIQDNILTYPNVLEGVNLKYVLNINGIAKYFEITNAEAVKNNDLTSYTFDLADNTKIQKTDEKKDKLQAILESKGVTNNSSPILTKAKEGIELIKETKEVSETKTTEIPQIPIATTPLPSSPTSSSSSVSQNSTPINPVTSGSSVSSSTSNSTSSFSTSSSSSASSSETPPVTPIIPPATKTEIVTTTQNKTETEIQAVKETIKVKIVKELDTKIVKLEEIKKEEEAKGDKKDEQLLELTKKTIESVKSLNTEVKTNSINLTDEKKVASSIKAVENVSSGSEVLTVSNNEDKIKLGLPEIFEQNVKNIKTIASTISQAKDKLTISIDKDYLNSVDRKFPILVDPAITTNLDKLRDTTIFSKLKDQNFGYKHHLSVGGSSTINVIGNQYYLNTSRAYLGFWIPDDIFWSASTVIDARLKLYQYDGNRFRMEVFNSYDFDELKSTWNNPTGGNPGRAEYRGDMWSINGEGWTESSNLASLFNDNVTGRGQSLKVQLNDDREDLGSNSIRSAVFCSKENSPFNEAIMCSKTVSINHI